MIRGKMIKGLEKFLEKPLKIDDLNVENSIKQITDIILNLQAENAALRERLEKAVELPFFQKDGEVIVLIYKNNDGIILTEKYIEDEYYDGKRGNEAALARLAELKGENRGKER